MNLPYLHSPVTFRVTVETQGARAEDLLALAVGVRALIDGTLKAPLEAPTNTVVDFNGSRVVVDTVVPPSPNGEKRDRSYDVEVVVDPGKIANIEVGELLPLPSFLQWPGQPEKLAKHKSVKHPFRTTRVDVAEDAKPYFTLRAYDVGHARVWPIVLEEDEGVPATADTSKFEYPTCQPGWVTAIEVKNISTEKRVFRATVIGQEFVPIAEAK